MTKTILVVLDSCRFDSYEKADTQIIDENIGPVVRAHSNTNHTISSYTDFMCMNDLPRPVDYSLPIPVAREFNYIQNYKGPVFFLSDNVHLHPSNLHVKGLLKLNLFKSYEMFEPSFSACKKIISRASKLSLGDNYLLILWFGETHQPYAFGNNVNKNWKAFVKRVSSYNKGADNIPNSEMEYMHTRQISACSFILNQLWAGFLSCHREAHIIITSDHGESFGEGHIFGHGNDINVAQFEVPLVVKN